MIHNIIFDLGNVLLKFEPMKFLLNSYNEEKSNALHKCIFSSQEWLDLDRGIIDNDEAVAIIAGRCPEYYEDIKDIINNWTQILTSIQGSIEVLESLKAKGYKLYLLSNFHRQAFAEVYSKYEFFNKFDGMVVSCDVLLLKPEEEIFLELCRKYGIKPQESVFIDDTYVNIEAARNLGFSAIHFTGPEQLRDELLSRDIVL